MDPWQEPVRGEPLTAAAFALDGVERLRGWGRLWRPTPMFHLLGVHITQVVNGSAVASMPVTPWLLHPDGVMEVGFLADAVSGVAADTILKPRTIITPLQGGYRPLRVVDEGCRMLVARGSVIRSSPSWVYVEGQVEDGEGRAIAHFSWHMMVKPVDFRVPDETPQFAPISEPTYATPDPYRRSVPADRYAVIERFHEEGVVATFRAIAAGEAPSPPLYSLLGIRPTRASAGTVATELATSGWLRSVHPTQVTPSYLRTHAVSTGVAAIWSIADRGTWPAILDVNSAIVGSAPADGRPISARAVADRLSADVAQARVETLDGDRRLAVTDVTARLLEGPHRQRERGERALATVVFTDIVGSTLAAERLGDEAWRHLLERHASMVRGWVHEHGGRVVKSTGDGVLATFESPTAAIDAVRALRDDVHRLGIEIRAGLHAGEVELIGGDVAGLAVHVAARIEAAAGPGEILVSDTVRTLMMGSRLEFTDRGPHDLKGVEDPVRLYAVEG